MRTSLRLAKRQVVFRWFPLILLLVIVVQLPLVQAQDGGGQQVSGLYELIIEGPTLDRICLNETIAISFKVQASVLVAGVPSSGRVTVGSTDVTVFPLDPDIASAEMVLGSRGLTPDVPLDYAIGVKGVAVGRTSLVVQVAGSNINRFGAASSFRLEKTIPLQVVNCRYKVTLHSMWTPNLYGTPAIMSLIFPDSLLTSTRGVTFTNPDAKSLTNAMEWTTTVNRWKGCRPGTHSEPAFAPTLTAELVDDDLSLSVEYAMIPTQTSFYLDTCPTLPIVDPDCRNYPDGRCPVFAPPEFFTPQNLSNVTIPATGGTKTVAHTLKHVTGSAAGYTTITVTPVRQ